MKDHFNIFHWEFYTQDNEKTVYVYEKRSGDVIGHMTHIDDLDVIRKILDEENDWDEDDVNYFIEENIE